MPVANIISDYVGRKRDISIMQYPDASIPDTQTVDIEFGKNPRFCAGIQKLVQKYTIVLLTNIGSQQYYPEFGANFLHKLKAGISPVDSIAMSQMFSLANYQTVVLLRAYQIGKPTIPKDERIDNASLKKLVLYGGYAAFDIKILSEAGDTLDFLVPLPK